jgi:gliding motility-associatede transport system auxiliary component
VRRSASLLGLVGLVLLLFAAVAAVLTRARGPIDILFVAVNAILGVFAVVAYLSVGLEQVRDLVSDRSARYGANVIVSSLIFVIILVIVNYLAGRYDRRIDLTEQGAYSLSTQSVNVVKGLQEDLTVQAFVEGGLAGELADQFATFAHYSPHFKYEFIDPDKSPELAERYQVKQYNTVRFQYGNESTTITQPTEENITNAIIRVTRTTQKIVCFVEGHGEPDTDDAQSAKGLASLKQALTNENYQVKKVLLAAEQAMPSDCTAVVVAGPEKPFLDVELQRLEKYLDGGGRALLLLPAREGLEFEPLLSKLGVKLGNDVVVDQVIRLFQGPALGLTPLINSYGSHEITRDFKQRTIFPMSRSVRADATGKPGIQATELAKTSASSWAETDLEGIFVRGEANLDAGVDTKGPVPVAVAVDIDLKQKGGTGTARLAVYGSVEMAENREIEGTYYNRDLLLNTISWLVGQSDLVSIRPRGIRASRIQFTPDQMTAIFYLSVLVVPELLLLVGIGVWWRRE